MTVEQARALIGRVTSDPEFAARLEATPIEQRRALLEEAGYGDVRLGHISQVLPASAGGELTDEEFAAVAGGSHLKTAAMTGAGGSFVISIFAAPAAAAAV